MVKVGAVGHTYFTLKLMHAFTLSKPSLKFCAVGICMICMCVWVCKSVHVEVKGGLGVDRHLSSSEMVLSSL